MTRFLLLVSMWLYQPAPVRIMTIFPDPNQPGHALRIEISQHRIDLNDFIWVSRTYVPDLYNNPPSKIVHYPACRYVTAKSVKIDPNCFEKGYRLCLPEAAYILREGNP
jgi:hypothetical protein